MSFKEGWNHNRPFIEHDPVDEVQYPPEYLKIEKWIDGSWVTTGWAPNLKAVEQHAVAVGGSVRATNNVLAVVYERKETLDSETELCDTSCPEHN